MTKANTMIVEDEFIIQHQLKMTLEEMGYRVIATASETDEAIKKVDKQNPDGYTVKWRNGWD